MKEITLKNIEKALLRIALSLEKKNTTQLNFKIDEKSSVFIWDPDENYLKESILYPGEKMVEGYGPVMPSYKGLLDDAEITALIEYIKTLK